MIKLLKNVMFFHPVITCIILQKFCLSILRQNQK